MSPIDRPRALVVFDSRHGSTAEVAERIGQVLTATGQTAFVRHVADVDVDDLGDVDLVVIGGAIRFDRWMPGAAAFVRDHRRQLADVPTACFFTCLALSRPSDASTRSADRYEQRIRAIAPEVEPIAVGRFAGVLDYSPMAPVNRVVAKVALTLRGARAGDHRDWEQIESWARSLARAVQPA